MAEEITHGKFSTFDKVMAVTNYLRSTYTYKDKIEIPQDEEQIEWFMFNGQEGFCNYFATAEVLMLRSNGIPARFVVGYAQGELAGNGYGFSVRKKVSHSWVEVYFPDVGWIIFEPTPSQPGLVYFEENFSDMQLNRRDSIYLERLFSEDLIEKEAYLEWNQSYTEDKELEDEAVVENQSKWVFWFYPISILLLLYFSIHKLVITREKTIKLPIRIAQNIEKKHKKVPNWIKRWAVYEELPLIEKQYKNITNATDIFHLIEKSNQTPKEYFDALAAVIWNEKEIIAEFSSAYHQLLFSEAKSEYEDEVRQAYRGIIKAIVLKKLDGIKEYFKIRLKRLKNR